MIMATDEILPPLGTLMTLIKFYGLFDSLYDLWQICDFSLNLAEHIMIGLCSNINRGSDSDVIWKYK